MLRSVMSDKQDHIVEQVMFTNVEFLNEIPLSMLEASVVGVRQEWSIDLDKPLLQPQPQTAIPEVEKIAAPSGFTLMSDKVLMLQQDAAVRRLMYTDGLASVSVYVAASGGSGQHELIGLSGMGAVHAHGHRQGDWHITVVGEVPQPTVTMVGNSVALAIP